MTGPGALPGATLRSGMNEGQRVSWQQRMEASVDYLERGLEGEIDYGRAAAEANCSTFHFLRMFEVVTGVTAGEYVRRRRLSLAALELSEGRRW